MQKLKKFWKSLGPGLITGASDDEPSGIATYTIAGAKYGLATLWMALFTLPLMIAVQEMCARIGRLSGMGLAGNMKKYYPRWLLYLMAFLIVGVNTINIGADMSAMAESVALIMPLPPKLSAIIMTLLILLVVVVLSYKKLFTIFKWASITLFSYVIAAFTVSQDWGTVFNSLFIPRLELTKDFFVITVAFFGTTIAPYLFFWQANQEAEERVIEQCKPGKICRIKPIISDDELERVQIDTRIGMTFSNIITFFIIILAASTLFRAGINDIESLDQAAHALRPLAGDYAYVLFTVGILGSGFLAIPVLAGSAAYVMSEVMGWPKGLNQTFNKAKGFYGVIIASTLVGLLIPLLGFHPIKALFYTAILFGFIAPVIISMIIHMANNPKIVGVHKNSWTMNLLGNITLVVMGLAVIITLLTI